MMAIFLIQEKNKSIKNKVIINDTFWCTIFQGQFDTLSADWITIQVLLKEWKDKCQVTSKVSKMSENNSHHTLLVMHTVLSVMTDVIGITVYSYLNVISWLLYLLFS